MTLTEIQTTLDKMKDMANQRQVDHEKLHSMEDALHHMVLLVISDGAPNAKELAKAALKSLEIEFARWTS